MMTRKFAVKSNPTADTDKQVPSDAASDASSSKAPSMRIRCFYCTEKSSHSPWIEKVVHFLKVSCTFFS